MSKCPHCNGQGVRPEVMHVANGKCFACNGTGIAKEYVDTPEYTLHRFKFANDIRLFVYIKPCNTLADISVIDSSIEDNLSKYKDLYSLSIEDARKYYKDMCKDYGKPIQF